MKKLISAILVTCMLFTMAACGNMERPPEELPEPPKLDGPIETAEPEPYDPGTDVIPSPVIPGGEIEDEPDGGLNAFISKTLRPTFEELAGKNRVYSPMNVYLAMAMLADVTDGHTREQILNVLGATDIDALRKEAKKLREESFSEGGESYGIPEATILPSASFWLRNEYMYNQETLRDLAEYYYAAAFCGEMGSAEYTQQLRDWINERTNHLLEQQANGLSLDPQTVLALVTTLYFKANWSESFNESATEDDVFYADAGEESVPFMHKKDSMPYYVGDKFTAVYLYMSSGNGMWVLLPNEGVSLEEMLQSDEATEFLTYEEKFEKCMYPEVKLSLPKFDIDSDMDMVSMFAHLGVIDVFDPSVADFSRLTDETGLYVSDIEHAARVKIDEEGCEAAAFTMITTKATGIIMEQEIVEFNCNRPFFFAITGSSDQMLFAGAVNTIEG